MALAAMSAVEAEARPYHPYWLEGPHVVHGYYGPGPYGHYRKREAEAEAEADAHGYGYGHHYGHRYH